MTAYNFAWLIYNIYKYQAKLFIFLTNWTYLILNLYFLHATALTLCALYKKHKGASSTINETQPSVEKGCGDDNANQNEKTTKEAREEDVLRLPQKISWLFYVISANNSLLITAGYWTLRILFEVDEPIDANNITKHTLNSVFMLIDTFLSSIPVRLFHSVYPLLYVIVYIAFTFVYWQLGGTNYEGEPYIYSLLDYNNFDSSTGCIIAFSLLLIQPVLQLMLLGLVKLRDRLRPKHETIRTVSSIPI